VALTAVQFTVTNELCPYVVNGISCMFYYPGPVALFYRFRCKWNWRYSDPLCVMCCYMAFWPGDISL